MQTEDWLQFLVRFMRGKEGPSINFMADLHKHFQDLPQEEYIAILRKLGA